MKNINNSYFQFVIVGLLLICIGLLIGLNINKEEKYVERSNATNINNGNKKSEDLSKSTTEEKENSTTEQINSEENKTSTNSANANQNNQVASNNNSNSSTSSIINNNSTAMPENVTYSNNDLTVISSLEDTLTKVNNAKNDSSFATSAKATFINIVDFLFYGGTIKGVTFNGLTDAGKSQVLKLASKIDSAIESKIPGYKDSISNTASSAFKKASEVIKAGANNLNDFAYEKLGEENYNSIISAKDELVTYTKNAFSFIGDVGSNLFTSAKDKLNSWYQNFKNK